MLIIVSLLFLCLLDISMVFGLNRFNYLNEIKMLNKLENDIYFILDNFLMNEANPRNARSRKLSDVSDVDAQNRKSKRRNGIVPDNDETKNAALDAQGTTGSWQSMGEMTNQDSVASRNPIGEVNIGHLNIDYFGDDKDKHIPG